MKKKVLGLAIVGLLAMGTIVSAASMWGTYKGRDIIRLTVNGVPVKVSDAPAVSMDGRTMIPIYLLQQAGVQYTWDQKNKTVDISSAAGTSDGKLDYVQQLAKTSDFYIGLENIGNMLTDFSGYLSLVVDGIDSGNEAGRIETAYDRLNTMIEMYNSYIPRRDSLEQESSVYNISFSDSYTVFDYYYDSIESYKKALIGVENFYANQTVANHNQFLDNSAKGYDFAFEGKSLAFDNYDLNMDRIQQQ